MDFAISLNARQTMRTLEQAVRHHATVLLEPSMWLTEDGLKGRLVGATADAILIEITEPPPLALDSIVGMYCDGSILLGQDRFLFNEHVLVAEVRSECWHVELSRPRRLQVCERRRYWRVALAETSPVHLEWTVGGRQGGATGRLYNVSGEGLACVVEAESAADLYIGETLSASFVLPGCDERFTLTAVLCNKTPAAEADRLILGMQFLEPASRGVDGPAKRLNEFLVRRYGGGVASASGDARVAGRAAL